MAGSVNKVILVGNLGRDPEIRRLGSGDPVCNLRIATSESWKDKSSGERKEKTEWHSVVIYNENLSRVAEQYLRKGSKVYVEGQLQTRKWTDQSGVEKYTTEVVLQRFRGELTILDGRGGGGGEFASEEEGGGQISRAATSKAAAAAGAGSVAAAHRAASAARLRLPPAAVAGVATTSTTIFRSRGGACFPSPRLRGEGMRVYPPVTLICRGTAAGRWRSMTKSWPFGLRVIASSTACASTASSGVARSTARRSAESSCPRQR